MLGDSNTSFFHKRSNGRRRKSKILSLEDGTGGLVEGKALKQHITDFYKQLFGKEEVANIHIQEHYGGWRGGYLKWRMTLWLDLFLYRN